MRYIKLSFLTITVILIELIISYFFAHKFELKMIDSMFYTGVFFTVITIYFSSSGGIITNASEAEIATSYQGLISKYNFKRTFATLSLNFFNIGSVIFLLIGFIVAILLPKL